MARKKTLTPSFLSGLESYAKEVLTDAQKVTVEKKSYLNEHKEEILQAVKKGYRYGIIAEYVTKELRKKDIPQSFTHKNKEGEDVTVEPKITSLEIRQLCEENENN